jgi:hypothetical protein
MRGYENFFVRKHSHFRANLLNVASGEDSHMASTEDALTGDRRVALINRGGQAAGEVV